MPLTSATAFYDIGVNSHVAHGEGPGDNVAVLGGRPEPIPPTCGTSPTPWSRQRSSPGGRQRPGDGGDTVNAERGSTRTNPTDDAARFDVESHGPQRATLPPMPWFDRCQPYETVRLIVHSRPAQL